MLELRTTAVPDELARSGAPTIDAAPIPACEICGAEDRDVVAEGFDYESLTCANRWRYVECRSCHHVWIDPRPAVDTLSVIYPPTYYAYNYDDISPIARKGKEALDALKLRKILASCDSLPGTYLDVGCGNGRYLDALGKRGVPADHLFGLELDESIVARLQGRGLQVYADRVETCSRFPEGSFDLITMFHVIEHVASPRAVVEKLASWLRPGGVLVLETPNVESLDARLFSRGTWGGYHIPRHWHLFRPATLSRLVQDQGLQVEGIRYQTGHAFWMFSIHHRLRYGTRPRPRLAAFFDPFSSLPPLLAFTAFDKVRGALGAKTSAMMVVARRPAPAPDRPEG